MCGGGTSDGTVVNGGFRQGTDNAGDGGKILIVSEYTVTEKDDVIIGQIGVGSRGINGCLHQGIKLCQTGVIGIYTMVLQGAAQYQQHDRAGSDSV